MQLYDYYHINSEEKPLDHLVDDGGFVGIFRKIAFVGDSLSSGEFEAINAQGNRSYHDMYEYSWGQYIARMCGNTAYNFSRGGMSAQQYCETFAEEKGFWDKDKACQAYVIALGVNEFLYDYAPAGSVADIDLADYSKNKKTFIGYYGQIIQRYKEIQPNAKFFLVTMVKHYDKQWAKDELLVEHRNALYALADLFENVYVIDLYTYLPEYTQEFWDNYGLHGHMNPMGYMFTAKIICSYMDYIIRHNMKAFKQAGFIGTAMYDKELDK